MKQFCLTLNFCQLSLQYVLEMVYIQYSCPAHWDKIVLTVQLTVLIVVLMFKKRMTKLTTTLLNIVFTILRITLISWLGKIVDITITYKVKIIIKLILYCSSSRYSLGDAHFVYILFFARLCFIIYVRVIDLDRG